MWTDFILMQMQLCAMLMKSCAKRDVEVFVRQRKVSVSLLFSAMMVIFCNKTFHIHGFRFPDDTLFEMSWDLWDVLTFLYSW